MCASGSRHRHVIATGALGGQPRGISNDDVEVLPVGSLGEKLRLVLTFARHGGLPAPGPGRELLFITPQQFEQDGRWSDVASLPEIGQLREFGVRVVPVGRLSEAAAEMKALRARHLVHDRLAQVLVASALLLGVMGYGWWSLRETHIPMVFLPAGGAALDAEPFQACFTADGGFYPIPLGRNGVARHIPVGETLGWRVQVGQSPTSRSGLSAWLAPEHYYLAQVMISERSRAKIKVPKQADADDFMVSPGGVWEWAWELNHQPENNGLVLLARAGSPFDPEALRAELLEKFPAADGGGEPTGLDVTAAVNFIAAKAPGAATFILQTVEGSVLCNG
jgi:hypothetical protein